MVYRVYVEKKPALAHEANALLKDAREFLGINGLTGVRVLNRYDAEKIEKDVFDYAVKTVLSEPQLDVVFDTLPQDDGIVFAVEYLPGQYDQRADSASQCIQLMAQGERPLLKTARVYILQGDLSENDIATVKKYVINPVEAREASLALPETLETVYDIPETVATLTGFTALSKEELASFVKQYGLAMDVDDIAFCQQYFLSEKRDPTITEIRMIDTYWSDHCRHTTFLTEIDDVHFEDALLQKAFDDYKQVRSELHRTKPMCLMDIATIAVKYLKKAGKLNKLDESEEINACTVKINVTVEGKDEPWLLLFKNETHNHPTEIEPFGGAATCIGGAIRDPLSGRSYVYGAMRVTGAANPLKNVEETIPGKLPQRKLVTTAAAGYSSYGNQIGLATGIVDEIYHDGYAAKRLEIGAVIAATPAGNVRREEPIPSDVVILLGGSTGRDGIGGATGSSKAHNVNSVKTCGAEVQKGNAPEERKLQRLFRNGDACRMIKRCNDFGAGGVSVAIGELADGLVIDLNAVPRKYEGLDGTELAISESQERMAVVVAKEDVEAFLAIASSENLQAVPVAVVQEEKRLVMHWNGNKIVDISREFLSSNGASKHISIDVAKKAPVEKKITGSFVENYKELAKDLNTCSRRGLSERFDSTIGAGTVLMPFGGKYQLTPIQAMVQKISVETQHTDDCSLMAWGYDPFLSEQSPYHGAYMAVVESVCKLIATGATFEEVYLTFQEYFARPGHDGKRWAAPLSALLGAFKAQMDLGIGAIGGKDSMSGTFEKLDVPPTLVSFAVTTEKTEDIVSPEFKKAGHAVVLLEAEKDENGLPIASSLMALFAKIKSCQKSAMWAVGRGGIAEGIMKMAFGNGFGFTFDSGMSVEQLFARRGAAFLLETEDESIGQVIGHVNDTREFVLGNAAISEEALLSLYENTLEPVYPVQAKAEKGLLCAYTYEAQDRVTPKIHVAKPRVLIPVFPGTNCEYDTAKAVNDAGGIAQIVVINNLSSDGIKRSIDDFANALRDSQIVFIPGGFSGGDEPDGSGKFITAFFRNAAIKEGVMSLLDDRDGLVGGICNGFQALIKLGLVPYGRIMDTDANCPTLTFNTIGRHQSRIVHTRVASNKSPWLANTKPAQIYTVPISHGEGRFYADEELVKQLAANGQIATQYVDLQGNVTEGIAYNPNGSICAIEGITSPDGRVFGKMGHSERIGSGLYKNVEGNYAIGMFEAAVAYFK